MGRPRRTTEQEWFDVFSDADVSEQVVMLRMIEELHRQKRRGRIGEPQTSPETQEES